MKKRWMAGGAAALALLASAAAVWAQAANAGGEVIKVDVATARVTIKHSGIKNLDMPPMTMAFKVRDAKLLDGVVVGDRVQFAAERVEGQYQVTSLSRAP